MREAAGMSTAILRFKRGLLISALAGGVLVASASAATAATMVTSDTVSWKAVWQPSSGSFQSGTCKVKSDAEIETFPCVITGRFIPMAKAAEIESIVSSPDGTIVVPPVIVPLFSSKPPIFTYKGLGPCQEREPVEPGSKEEVSYPCQVTMRVTFNSAKNTLSGAYTVKESSTAP
jgi:hypothetical protein